MRELAGLVMLKELENKCDLSFHQLKKKYDKDIVIIKRISYIYADALPLELRNKTTILTNYVQLTELARTLNVNKKTLKDRVKIMQDLDINLYFDYMFVENVYFIKLTDEMQSLFSKYMSFVITKKEHKEVEFCKLFGDLTVGFY